MKRIDNKPRDGWQAKVEKIGLTFHSPEGQVYWDESAVYELTSAEVDILEKAGNDLHELCLRAAQHVIDNNLFHLLAIPEEAIPYIVNSWNRDDFSLYGRFDLAYTPGQPPKMLEYNADTPTALVEAAVAQWYWLKDQFPGNDQFNSIHEKLIAAWKKLGAERVHLGSLSSHLEDEQTVLYLTDTCFQAGLQVETLSLEQIGFDAQRKRFVDMAEKGVTHYFKLFPWEWMWDSEYAPQLKLEVCQFVEPMWKMLLSNKGILPILWKLFPGHPNLLPAAFSLEEMRAFHSGDYVTKPMLSREGANVTIYSNDIPAEKTEGEYGAEGSIFQALAPIPSFEGHHPVCGLWIVNHEACGLGIREDVKIITGNTSRFIPHYFR